MDLQWAKECKWADPWLLDVAVRRFPFFVRSKRIFAQAYRDSELCSWMKDRQLVLANDVRSEGDMIHWERNAFLFADEREAILFKLRFG